MRLRTADVHHLMNRIGFGATPDDVGAMLDRSPEQVVTPLIRTTPEPSSSPDLSDVVELEQTFIRERFRRGRRNRSRRERPDRNDPEIRQRVRQIRQANFRGVRDIATWWFKQMLHSPNSLHEKMTLFWHNHFTTSFLDVRRAVFIYNQHMLIRRHALGSFGAFLLDISRDAAMLEYLDNAQNRKEHPNENYARELLELFTMGEGHYTDQDVKEAARAFTGWTHDPFGRFVFREAWHDGGTKTFLGRRGRFNGEDIIDIILEHPQTARFIVTKIWRTFVHPEPDPDIIEPFARAFRESDYNIGKLVHLIFTSDAFYRPENRGMIIKSPVEFVVGTLRRMNVDFPAMESLWDLTGILGQRLFFPPTVAGWPGGRLWLSSSTLTLRYAFLRLLITGEIPDFESTGRRRRAVLPRMMRAPYDPTRVVPDDVIEHPLKATDYLIEHFLPYGISSERLEKIRSYGETVYRETRHPVPALRRLTYLICSMPEYQLA